MFLILQKGDSKFQGSYVQDSLKGKITIMASTTLLNSCGSESAACSPSLKMECPRVNFTLSFLILSRATHQSDRLYDNSANSFIQQ